MSSTSFGAVGLSEEPSGMPVPIVGTTTVSPTTIHVGTSEANQTDEVYLWAANIATTEQTISIQLYDGDSTRTILFPMTIGPNLGPVRLLDGLRVNSGVTIEAFCSTPATFTVAGHINRITTE